jgi:hypothetical protein
LSLATLGKNDPIKSSPLLAAAVLGNSSRPSELRVLGNDAVLPSGRTAVFILESAAVVVRKITLS